MNTSNNLVIKSSVVKLTINGGPDFIEFDPNDVLFMDGFYNLIEQFSLKQAEYSNLLNISPDAVNEAGLPLNAKESIQAIKEICQFTHAQIDAMMGAGSSLKLFGSRLSFSPIQQFFEGILPYIKKTRSERMEKYLPPSPRKRSKK